MQDEMLPEAPEEADFPQSSKRLAVLETEAHAEEIVALAAGKDGMEYVRPALRSAAAPLGAPKWAAARDWESHRPLEMRPAPPPTVPYPATWHRRHGRFCALKGAGQTLHILRARKVY